MNENDTDTTEAVAQALDGLQSSDIANFVMASVHGDVSDEPRTLEGSFPGTRDRAMGYALEVCEIAAEHDLDAEREYVGRGDEYESQHIIKIHIEGGE